ncbi:alpha-tocopherol transfer protein-like isoform X2 [Frankliniella occidentalis]|uniref:Alpha-tocopherol transfer protein-like isoform X2 n=2 Tax=Frankliniella occidentalis TaxID=133901 RepID=A0A6J1SEZ2_FRAOC|nr:alpha-tocopherol transfer protein-like isoform X2 [Frankliniella occidentalis]
MQEDGAARAAGDAAAMGGSRDAVDVQEVDDPEQDQFEDAVDTSGSGTDAIGCAFRDMAEAARSWTLDGALRDNAEIERSQVNALRSWCQESEILPDIAEPLLVAFLHCSRGDLEQAKAVVRVYESVRSKTPEVFADRSFHSEEVQRAKGVGYFCVLPNKTPEGYRVIVQALRDPDPTVFVYSSSSKAQFLTMDAVVRAEPTAPGYVCVFDMNAVQMSHMWAWGIRLPRKVFRYLQEGLPLRMQRIHFLNTTPLMDRVMRMLRPFIRKELQSIFQFHTADDMENLYKMIPQDCLPENYGGFLPPLEKLQDYTDKFLAEMNNMIPT